jgi:hypothetical protein
MPNPTRVCPKCGREDLIQKVSGVYAAGISTTTVQVPVVPGVDAYGSTTKTMPVSSGLSQRLKPPAYPGDKEPQVSGGCGLVILAVGGIGGWLVTVEASTGIQILAGLIGIAALTFTYTHFMYEPEVKEYHRLRSMWQRARPIWDRLYYCSRDDCVFDPETGEYRNSAQINDLLYG